MKQGPSVIKASLHQNAKSHDNIKVLLLLYMRMGPKTAACLKTVAQFLSSAQLTCMLEFGGVFC